MYQGENAWKPSFALGIVMLLIGAIMCLFTGIWYAPTFGMLYAGYSSASTGILGKIILVLTR